MRVAFIVEAFPVLSQTFVLNQIIGLIDRGHEVDIYAEFSSDTQKVHPDVEKYQLLQRTYYHPRVPRNKRDRLLKGLRLAITNLPKAPLRVLRSLNIAKYGKDAASLRLLYAAIPLLEKPEKYDIIQCHFGLLGIKGMLLREIGALQGKLITTFHGVDISQNLKLLGEQVYNDLYKTGDYFLPISYYWKERLMQLGCDKEKIAVHRMGIDSQRFTFMERSPSSDGCVRLVSIARLVEKKGIEYGIRAVAAIVQQGLNVEYTIIGDGDLYPQLVALIQSLKVGHAVKLVGWKDQMEVVEILNQSHILLAPSVTGEDGNQEGIPVVLMEAMAMGIPVVSTYHSGIPELVEDGVSGFLVPERDVEALTHKVTELVRQPDRWAAMGRAGRARVEAEYDIHLLNDRLVNLYQQLLEVGVST
jgi:colanic acid/amylovoran biosynthesis glycosyltransferase